MMSSLHLSRSGAAVSHELEGLAVLVRSFTVEVATKGRSGRGTGVVWHADGIIVTNAHVARGATLSVARPDERVLEARILVGINAMIVGGLGVAIPSNVVRRFLREVATSGALARSTAWAA